MICLLSIKEDFTRNWAIQAYGILLPEWQADNKFLCADLTLRLDLPNTRGHHTHSSHRAVAMHFFSSLPTAIPFTLIRNENHCGDLIESIKRNYLLYSNWFSIGSIFVRSFSVFQLHQMYLAYGDVGLYCIFAFIVIENIVEMYRFCRVSRSKNIFDLILIQNSNYFGILKKKQTKKTNNEPRLEAHIWTSIEMAPLGSS